MSTNDERREVAARLRSLKFTFEDDLEYELSAFYDALECNPRQKRWEINPYWFLADLIEPELERTCGEWRGGEYITNGGFTETYAELWCEHCDILLDEDWQYCPECGAKVVEW